MTQDSGDKISKQSMSEDSESHINLISLFEKNGEKSGDRGADSILKALETNEREIRRQLVLVADIARRASLYGPECSAAIKECATLDGPAYKELQKHIN